MEKVTADGEDFNEDDYANHPLVKRIVCDPGTLGGKPRLEGRRISVQLILERIAAEMPREKLKYEYDLTDEEIRAALLYAAWKMGIADATLPR